MMVLKNKKSTFVIMGLVYAIAAFVYSYLDGQVISGLVNGLVGGILISTIPFFFLNRTEKKSENLRKQIESKRKIICQGNAAYRKAGMNAVSGWMFLSEDAIEFYRDNANIGGSNIAILLDDITSVSAKRNILKVATMEKTYSFSAPQAKVWKEQIDQTIAS